MPRRNRLILMVGVLAIAQPPAARAAQTPAPVDVTIHDHAFVPSIVHAQPGQPIIWHNTDQDAHTVTSGADNVDDARWTSSAPIADGQTFTLHLTAPGTYPYFCKPHQYEASMHGTIIIAP